MKYVALFSLSLLLATNIFAQTTYPSGVTGNIARWNFTNSGTVTSLSDVSGNSNNGATTNLITANGFRNLLNKAMHFNGTTSYALVPHNSILSPSQITIVALVRPTGFYSGNCQGNNIIYKCYDYFTKPGCWAMFIADNDGNCGTFTPTKEMLEFAGPSYATYTLTNPPYINANSWYFLVISYDGNQIKRYQVPMDTNTYYTTISPISTSILGTALGSNIYDVRIGATQNPPFLYWYNGDMDEIVLFNKILTDTEIQSVYHYLWGQLDISVADSVFCGSDSFNVNYTYYNPDLFQPGNVFTAQLSDASGSFATPLAIGSLASTNLTGVIKCSIPSSVSVGSGYRIRIEASNAHFISPDNGKNLLINNTVPVNISLGADVSICEGKTTKLQPTGTISSGATYLWNTGSTAPFINVGTAGTYWVQVSSACGVGSDTVSVNVFPYPTVSIGNDTLICEGQSITLNAAQPAGYTYAWSTGATGNSVTVHEKGVYWVKVTNNGCTSSDSLKLDLIIPPFIDLGKDTILCIGDELQLPKIISSGADYTILWSDNSTLHTFTISDSGKYFATITNQCGSAADTISVGSQNCFFWFPSAFSPDGNGLNDKARLLGGLGGITEFYLAVYNRWGNNVFHTGNKYDGWDGTYKGTKCEIGTYYYMIRFKFLGKSQFMKGDLTLIR